MKRSNVGKDAAVLTAAKTITLLISLVTSMLLSRFRTLEEYGTFSQMILVISLVTSLFMLGLPDSANYFLARAETAKERNRFLSVYYTLNTCLCAVIGVVLAFAAPLIEKYFDNELIGSFAYFLAFFPWASITAGSIGNVLVVYGKLKKLFAVNLISSLVSFGSVIIVQLTRLSFSEYILFYLCGNMAVALLVYFIVNRIDGRLRVSLDAEYIGEILKYSVPIGLATLVGTLNIQLDKLMIGSLTDTASLAVYTNAGKELPLTVVASSLTAVLLPQMAKKLKKKKTDEAAALWNDSVRLSYIIICFFVTACVVFAPQIMTILYSEKYLPGVQVFRVYSLVLLLRTTYFGLMLNSIGKTRFILYSSIAALAINCTLNYVLFRCFGLVGPAVATFISILLVNLLQLIVTSRIMHISFLRIFPWLDLLKISLVNLLWGAGAYAAVRLARLGTGSKDIVVCVAAGAVILSAYSLVMFKKTKRLWISLNSGKDEAES